MCWEWCQKQNTHTTHTCMYTHTHCLHYSENLNVGSLLPSHSHLICSPPLPPLPLTLHSEGDVCRGSPNNIGGGAGVNTSLSPLHIVELQRCVATEDAFVCPLEHVRCGTGRRRAKHGDICGFIDCPVRQSKPGRGDGCVHSTSGKGREKKRCYR